MVDPLDYVTDGKNPDLHSLLPRIADDVDTLMFKMHTSGCNLKPVTQVFFELIELDVCMCELFPPQGRNLVSEFASAR